MEMQCKERVDLLEALRRSKKEAQEKEAGDRSSSSSTTRGRPSIPRKPENMMNQYSAAGWIGEGSVNPVSYPDLSRHGPPLPQRPTLLKKDSEPVPERPSSSSHLESLPLPSPYSTPTLPLPPKKTSRTPSPDKKGRAMLTTLRTKDGKKPAKSPRSSAKRFNAPPASSKAAGLAWESISKISGQKLGQNLAGRNGSTVTLESAHRDSAGESASSRPESTNMTDSEDHALGGNALVRPEGHYQPDLLSPQDLRQVGSSAVPPNHGQNGLSGLRSQPSSDLITLEPPTPPTREAVIPMINESRSPETKSKSPIRPKVPDFPSYRTEFPQTQPSSRAVAEFNARNLKRQEDKSLSASLHSVQGSPDRRVRPAGISTITRRPVANISSTRSPKHDRDEAGKLHSSESNEENTSSSHELEEKKTRPPRKIRENPVPVDPVINSPTSPKDRKDVSNRTLSNNASPSGGWQERLKYIKKHLPKGVDEGAAKQIFNEIVVQGDEVHWDDVAGLEIAKKALKEAVVYPFLRPDLFMGLREPARGMLLFGPPGTGKTMLARAVATESRSTFFAISASSLTSKWLGESEKLVRALFLLAKALAPSIIFVDEIDSLLSSRGGSSEHESTRRIKTEFLIQWSDLQRAAAGSKQTDKQTAEGDASRVLVLAATNMPWAIDEAARRRFVRRQYIPLPEAPVRGEQLKTLLGHQKHNLKKNDIAVLVELTDGTYHVSYFSFLTVQADRISPVRVFRQ